MYVSSQNLGSDAVLSVDEITASSVVEIHLAGHSPDARFGNGLLIDSHDSPVCEQVWRLYEQLITRIGPKPTLVERDDNIPPFVELRQERDRADRLLRSTDCKMLEAFNA